MKIRYPYLKDINFLKNFDELHLKEQYVKITILDWNENSIKEIQGQVVSGSLNVDGQSSIRRTCSINFIADIAQVKLTDTKNLLSINKKVQLEIGFLNLTDRYLQYDKIWFPLGIFIIVNPSLSYNNTGVNISLQLKDKMCLLNGECGGVIPAAVDFANLEQYDENGQLIIKKPTIFKIIQEMVHHYGREQVGKILIDGLDTKVKQVVRWQGDKPLYLVEKKINKEEENSEKACFFTIDPTIPLSLSEEEGNYQEFSLGDDIGYQLVDFVYPDELIADAGSTVCSVLDTIKEKLGNFEYFYDINGNFIFREIKNYLNKKYSSQIIQEVKNNSIIKNLNANSNHYLFDSSMGRTVYRFSNKDIITSYANTPQYNMIKNDFIVWGTRKTLDGLEFPIRYHLAIDNKPQTGKYYEVYFYYDEEKGYEVPFLPHKTIIINEIINESLVFSINKRLILNGVEQEKTIYDILKTIISFRDPSKILVIHYNEEVSTSLEEGSLISLEEKMIFVSWNNEEQNFHDFQFPINISIIQTNDWRSELFLQGLFTRGESTDSNYYYTELLNEWPKLYNLKANEFSLDVPINSHVISINNLDSTSISSINSFYTGSWRDVSFNHMNSLDYFLDFISPQSGIGSLSIDLIGRRTKVLNDKGVNCIFEPEIPDYIIIENGDNVASDRKDCIENGYKYLQVDSSIISGLSKGGHYNGAFTAIQDLLYQHTSYNESITIQCLPIYHLEPNTRIFVDNEDSDIHGDYIIKSFSLPLDINGTMSITASKVLDKI